MTFFQGPGFFAEKTPLRGTWIQQPMTCWGSLEFHRIAWIPGKKTNIGSQKLFLLDLYRSFWLTSHIPFNKIQPPKPPGGAEFKV